MAKSRVGHQRLVWQQTSRGWTAVRARVPSRSHSRSERVPRPPEHRAAVGAEDSAGGGDLLQVAELYVGSQLAAELAKRIGAVPTALLALWLLSKGKRK
jgi:hypothetical protein